MQQQLQQQAQQLAQQQQQLLQHAQYAAASSSPPPAAAAAAAASIAKPLVKPRPPSTFNATDKAGELDQWEREMRYQFAAYGAALATDSARIAHAVSYLGAIPLQWWDANPAHHDVDTWEGFVKLLRDRPVNAAKLARIELFKIRQGASQTAGAHAARFQELLVALPMMHEDDKIHLFVHSLTPALKRRVGDKDFATLGAAINAAVQSEGLYGAQLATDASGGYGAGASAGGSAMEVNHLDDDDEYPYERRAGPLSTKPAEEQLAILRERLFALESTRSTRQYKKADRRGAPDHVENLDEETLQERLAGNACLRCGSHSHWKSDCPQAPSRKTAGRR
jgi:hypothetical protein